MTDNVARKLAHEVLCDMAQNTLLRQMEDRADNDDPDDVSPSVVLPDFKILAAALQDAYSQGVVDGIDRAISVIHSPRPEVGHVAL